MSANNRRPCDIRRLNDLVAQFENLLFFAPVLVLVKLDAQAVRAFEGIQNRHSRLGNNGNRWFLQGTLFLTDQFVHPSRFERRLLPESRRGPVGSHPGSPGISRTRFHPISNPTF